jgi:hypothetical protein
VIAVVVAVLTKQSSTESDTVRNRVVTPDNIDEVIADMDNQRVETGTYHVSMNTTWHFNSGNPTSTDAYVENSTMNTNDVYFDIVRSDTEETIYSSPIIPIGSHLEDITLDNALTEGTYTCVLTYHLLDESDKPVSKVNLTLKLVVE